MNSQLPAFPGPGWTFRTWSDRSPGWERVTAARFTHVFTLPGNELAAHRTGRTWLVPESESPHSLGAVVVKTYLYPTFRDRRRGLLRNTFLAPSRVDRESRNLRELARHGLNPPVWLECSEARRRGVLHASSLITRHIPSQPMDQVLGSTNSPERWIDLLADFAARLHRHGYVDRDLHLRNLLLTPEKTLVKIDCPRGSFVPAWWLDRSRRRDRDSLGEDVLRLSGEQAARRFRDRYELSFVSR